MEAKVDDAERGCTVTTSERFQLSERETHIFTYCDQADRLKSVEKNRERLIRANTTMTREPQKTVMFTGWIGDCLPRRKRVNEEGTRKIKRPVLCASIQPL